jgi:hypothetical protein
LFAGVGRALGEVYAAVKDPGSVVKWVAENHEEYPAHSGVEDK